MCVYSVGSIQHYFYFATVLIPGVEGMKHIVLLKSRYFDLAFFYTLE